MRVVADANTLLSGLFFRGNERRLLALAVQGRVTLVLPEDVVDEVYEVIGRKFGEDPELADATTRLESVLASSEFVPAEDYAPLVEPWARRLRDPPDAPVLACAEAVKPEGVVTGDRDILEAIDTRGIPVYRTRQVLARLQGRV